MSHYAQTRNDLLNSGHGDPELERIYAIADWAHARDISFDNLPPALYLPEQYRELFDVACNLLNTAMELDFDLQSTRH